MEDQGEGTESTPLRHDEVTDSPRSKRSHHHQKKGALDLVLRPVRWLTMLREEAHWSVVLGVVIVYGISQGLGVGLSRVSTQYYFKDEQKVQPSEAQVYVGLVQIPLILKPVWGLFTDVVPVLGFRRRPYFILAGFLLMTSMLVVSLHRSLHLAFALLYLMAGSTGIAMADVTIDACVTQCSISHPSLASDLQSLCGLCSSIGSLIGYSLSGVLIQLVGPKGVFGLLSLPAGLIMLVGMLLKESPSRNYAHKRVNEKFLDAGRAMWRTLRHRDVWKPSLFMFLSLTVSLHIHEGMFYWYTDAKGGPKFSKEAVGTIFSVGAIGSLMGVVLYQNLLKNHPFRSVVFWAQSLLVVSGLLDLVLVLRLNLKLGLPDYFFVVIDEGVTRMIGRVKWMPLLVLSSKLCPAGIEGTFFALLMSIDHLGLLVSSWGGGVLLHLVNVTRTEFDNLWLVILIRSFLRIIPVLLVFLVPKGDPNSSVLPAEILKNKRSDAKVESESVELTALTSEDSLA